jgi:hypothetical protein
LPATGGTPDNISGIGERCIVGIWLASFNTRMLPGAAHPVKNANNIKVTIILIKN